MSFRVPASVRSFTFWRRNGPSPPARNFPVRLMIATSSLKRMEILTILSSPEGRSPELSLGPRIRYSAFVARAEGPTQLSTQGKPGQVGGEILRGGRVPGKRGEGGARKS